MDKQFDQIESDVIEQLQRVKSFQGFSHTGIMECVANALAISIIRLLKRLGVNERDVLIYDERMARLRDHHISYSQKEPNHYGVAFYEYDKDSYDRFEVEGKYYEIFDYFYMDDRQVNCLPLQFCHIEDLEFIYDYLRMENNTPAKKRRFTIDRRENEKK